MLKSLLPVIAGFLLGFLFNTMMYVIPEYTDLATLLRSPAARLSSSLLSSLALPGPQSQPQPPHQPRVLCWIMTGPSNHMKKVSCQNISHWCFCSK